MAGVDYSKVKEPDYNPESIRQTSAVTEAIEKVGEIVLTIWQQREKIRDKLLEKEDPQKRSRGIYYDTDGIQESQSDEVRICPDCAGALRIESSSDRGMRILAVHIPRKACGKCKETGYQWYDSADSTQFEMLFLRDRTEDKYIEKKT
jgi:ribosomal protein S27AE